LKKTTGAPTVSERRRWLEWFSPLPF